MTTNIVLTENQTKAETIPLRSLLYIKWKKLLQNNVYISTRKPNSRFEINLSHTHYGISSRLRINFSAHPNLVLSPLNDFNLSTYNGKQHKILVRKPCTFNSN